jgi:hypothetical protein
MCSLDFAQCCCALAWLPCSQRSITMVLEMSVVPIGQVALAFATLVEM